MAFDRGNLMGPGRDWIVEQAEQAQYFLFGEVHATKEIGSLSATLFQDLKPSGYHHAAIEVGRFQTRWLEDLLRRKGWQGYQSFLKQGTNLLSVPFYFFEEDARLLQIAIEANSVQPALLGLDQEFIASGPAAIHQLTELARTDRAKKAVKDFTAAHSTNPMWAGVLPADAYTPLKAAFRAEDNTLALDYIDHMALSARIYAPFTGRGGSALKANADRETLMKRSFLRHIETLTREDGRSPKVYFKFGANHLFRGRSPTNVFPLGNFLMEYARAHEDSMFNIFVDCHAGMAFDIRSGGPTDCDGYFHGAETPFTRAMAEKADLALFDLRHLRENDAFLDAVDPRTRRLVFGFDAYLVFRAPTPATLMEGNTPKLN